MPSLRADTSLSTRRALVERARDQLARSSSPRLHASLIVTLSGLTGFLASFVMLRAGVYGMTLRYALAACAGYATFVGLIRVWIALQQRTVGEGIDVIGDTIGNLGSRGGRHTADSITFGGGHSGGGGASRAFVAPDTASPGRASSSGSGSSGSSSGGGWDFSLDLDELFWVVLAIALACIGIVAVGYVIYAAPLLLGEVALDAALLGGAYRGLRRADAQHWATGVVRRTAIPAAIVIACAAGFGYCGERLAPQARSIGGVIRTIGQKSSTAVTIPVTGART